MTDSPELVESALGLQGSPTRKPRSRQLAVIDRDEVAKRICQGALLFIYNDLVINASSWTRSHPGGELAILHFVGRDATNEVLAYHSSEALRRVERYAIARVVVDPQRGWTPLTPPIALGLVRHEDGQRGHWRREGRLRLAAAESSQNSDSSSNGRKDLAVLSLQPEQLEPSDSSLDQQKQHLYALAYRDLKSKLEAAGLFDKPGPLYGYGSDIIRYAALGALAIFFYLKTTGWSGQMASALFLGLMWHQLTFLAHDAGHTGITGNWTKDRAIGIAVANCIGGLSIGWWCDNHNIHHLVPNELEHDPDIQHIPFFAISKQFFGDLWSSYYKRIMAFDAASKTLISIQHRLYYIVLSLARVNLYVLSYSYLLGPKPRRNLMWATEMMGVAMFWTYFGSMIRHLPSWQMRLAYILVSHVAASPVHVQIVLSHFACSTEALGPVESFPARQLRTTMDVVCSPNIEFIHGGLHLQVTHHLFPRMPRHNLRQASSMVKEYCKDQELVYQEHGWIDGNKKVLNVLEDVANQLQFLKEVADNEIEEKLR
ncbi:fatty acid desaturase-domain-containing protein [Kockovaella imperatae]|uniref:Delta 8-(E)-sphingolipid desaturase n=1 Tax=Kockovaella imperatae TaxID=4999 RepID=A0A1Y1UTE4_9TREE|nr:fatty acid desaturase-domain-containing protein [Kockovaella imperatae]ORX41222.1 fatty acid desaturase-domain-containing protein [Kockovaella imperatae]